jgi:hypothetical protein
VKPAKSATPPDARSKSNFLRRRRVARARELERRAAPQGAGAANGPALPRRRQV